MVIQTLRHFCFALGAFLYFDWCHLKRHPFSWLSQLVQNLLYVVLFYFLVSSFVVDQQRQSASFMFVAFGISFQMLFQSWTAAGSNRIYFWQWQGLLEKILTAPLPRWLLLLIIGVNDLIKGFLKSLLILIVAWALVGFPQLHSIGFSFGKFLFVFGLSLLLTQCLNSIAVSASLLWKKANPVIFINSLSLSLATGVFVPTEKFPREIARIFEWNPLKVILDFLRQDDLQWDRVTQMKIISILLWILFFFGIAVFLFKKADQKLTQQACYQDI